MKRRALLAAVGASLVGTAGCSELQGSDSPTTTEPTPETTTETTTQTTRPTTGPIDESLPSFDGTTVQRQVSLAGVDDVADHPIAIDVKLLNDTVTGEQPARVRVTVTNEADEQRAFTPNEGDCALFNREKGVSDPAGVHLYQRDIPGYGPPCANAGRRGNLWRLNLSASTSCRILAYGCSQGTYDAGETQSSTYRVWDDHSVAGYMPPDTYRFERTVTIGDGDESEEFTWGFSLTIEQPD